MNESDLMNRLEKTADKVMETILKLKAKEKVLIITNPDIERISISQALYRASEKGKGKPCLIVQSEKKQSDFAEDAVIEAIKSEPDIIISISKNKLGKDRQAIASPWKIGEKTYDSTFHYLLGGVKKCRAFWSPGITRDMFIRTVPLDYNKLKKDCFFLKNILDRAAGIRITSDSGTDIYIGTGGRKALCDDGDFSAPGTGGNLPAGETFISPQPGSSSGIIVFDGSISTDEGDIIIKNPVKVKVEKGFVTSVDGGREAGILLKTIEKARKNAIQFEKEGKLPAGKGELYSRNAFNIGELGIGLNPEAEIRGNMLEDEKAFKTCHIAIGSNYDDDAPALIHLDGLVKNPTIKAVFPDSSGTVVMENGLIVY